MSRERVPTAAPENEAVAGARQETEAERLAADLQHLRDLIEHNRVEAARRYVKELEQRWPDAERVQHYARVLAPPVVQTRPDIPARSSEREWKWLKEHGHEYPGCWLAIFEGRLIAADPDRRVVTAQAEAAMKGEQTYLLFHQPGNSESK
jgi:hypothetical protein